MSSENISKSGKSPLGQIIYLGGPSSSGKSTYGKELAKQGEGEWKHLSRDDISIAREITLLTKESRGDKNFAAALELVKDHLNDKNKEDPEVVCLVLWGDRGPDIPSRNEKDNRF